MLGQATILATMKTAPSGIDDISPRHPIAVVAERTGLSQDVLRVWERRYQAVEPRRGAGGHRTYSDADIARLRLLHAVTSAGRSIGHVARLSTEALSRMAQEDAAARAQRVGARVSRVDGDQRSQAEELVEHALRLTSRLEAAELEHLLRRAAGRLGVTEFIEDVASPLLRRIGDDWHDGRMTIAHEHLASATIHDIVAEAMRALGQGSAEATVLVATPAGERHAIGAALVGAAVAAEGWRVLYLGADLPAKEISAAALATDARVVAVSLVYVPEPEQTLGELRTLRALLPASVLLLAGGGGATSIAGDLEKAGIRVGASLADLRDALRDVAAPAAA